MEEIKITAHTVKIARRAGIGADRDLTQCELDQIETRKTEQAARLARIAARRQG
jgi:hypothetical protein